MDRGFSTGARQYGYNKIVVPDPSGRKDAGGRLACIALGTRIEKNPDEAEVIRRIFEWAAEGVGLTSIVERLNAEGIPGTGEKRWTKSPVSRILKNERYLGRQIWGQQSVEREPGTGRRIMRDNPRSEWKVEERPELRIISDELWARTQKTRAEVREAVAPKRNLARGKDVSLPFNASSDWVRQMPRVWWRDGQCVRWLWKPSARLPSFMERGPRCMPEPPHNSDEGRRAADSRAAANGVDEALRSCIHFEGSREGDSKGICAAEGRESFLSASVGAGAHET